MHLSYQKKQEIVSEALRAKLGVNGSPNAWLHVVEMWDGEVIYCISANGADKTERRTYSIGEGGEVTLGEEATEMEREWTPAAFSVAFSAEGEGDESVVYEGVIFEAGIYPDKAFAISGEELAAAAAGFAPVDNDLEHKKTVLAGKLGKLEAVRMEPDGKTLTGRVRVPRLLHDLLGEPEGGERKKLGVSLAFDGAKRIIGNALTVNPRISNAQVVAAFASATGTAPGDSSLGLGERGAKPMKIRDFLSNLFGGNAAFDPDAEVSSLIAPGATQTPAGETPPASETAPAPAFSAEIAAMQEELSTIRKAKVRDAAVAFADEQVREGKALPAQRDKIVALFTSAVAADSDGAAAGVRFTAEGDIAEGANLASLREFFGGVQSHKLTDELVNSGQPGAMFGADQNDEQVKRLLNLTPLGRAALTK